MVADAMVALNLLERSEDRYRNAAISQRYLAGRSEDDFAPFLRFWNRVSYEAWRDLETSVRTDQPRPRSGPPGPEDQQIISQGIEASTRGPSRALARTYDFAAHRRVLDAGGGTGSFLLAILERFSGIKATLFDLPPVTVVARERLARHPAGSRIEIAAGDLLVDPLPKDHDVVILANVIHVFTPERNHHLLTRIREVVPAGARLLMVDRWTDAAHTKPVSAALLSGEYLLAAGGDVYSADEGRAWLADTGWIAVDHRPLADGWDVLIGEAQ
jgi:SAM-dependent methyltransferase